MHNLNWLKRSTACWLILGCLLLPIVVPAQVAGLDRTFQKPRIGMLSFNCLIGASMISGK